jgi:osmotically-inducible protein OsmY
MRKTHSTTKHFLAIGALLFAVLLTSFAIARSLTPARSSMGDAKTATADAGTPPDDASIEKCITDKLAASTALKNDGIKVTVKNGEATLTGTTKVAGHKGGATKLARGCGASKVANNITVAGGPSPATTPRAATTPAPRRKS